MFLPPSASIYLDFPFFTMLFMKIFATNINKPYTITENESVCNQATNKLPAFVL